MKQIRYGIIGTGNTVGIARNHINGLLQCKEMHLSAIYDECRERAEKTYQECNLTDVKICQSWQELLSSVDAVGICLPNHLHVEIAISALEAGKHVLIEKPVSVNAESMIPLLKAVEKHKEQIVMVAFNYREFPIYSFLKELVEKGGLGAVYHGHFQLGGNRIANPQVGLEWRMQRALSGPGAISDFGCHLLDLTQYILNPVCGSIKELKAFTTTMIEKRTDLSDGNLRRVDNDDCGVFIARMENGAVISYDTSRVGMWNHAISLECEGGMVYADFDKPDIVKIRRKAKSAGYGSEDVEVVSVSGMDGHEGILQNFSRCILGIEENSRTDAYAGRIQAMIDCMAETGTWLQEEMEGGMNK